MRRITSDSRARMPYFRLLFLPLGPAPLATLIALSITLRLSMLAWGYGLPLMLILLSWLCKYSFVFLDRLIAGDAELPVLSVEMILGSLGEWRSLLPLIVAIIYFLTSGAGMLWIGLVGAVLLTIAAIVCVPAVLAVQGWTGSLQQSLSPHICMVMVRILGRDYALMVAYLFAIVAICVVMPQIVGVLPTVVQIGLLIYAWLAVVAVTGGTLYTNRVDLDRETAFILVNQFRVSPEEKERLREQWMDSIYAAWRNNAQDNAWRSVTDWIANREDALDELRWLYFRVVAWEQPQLANCIVREMLPRLLAEGMEGEALRLVKERLEIDPDFRPHSAEQRQRLAQLAAQWGDRGAAETLLRDGHV
jgi:hypothetical protein